VNTTFQTVSATLYTSGEGYWSRESRGVRIRRMCLGYENDDRSFGELRVFFDPVDWDVEQHGLIYTDPQFLRGLQQHLNMMGLKGNDVDYSEQGMQGDDYVSLDVGEDFLDSWHYFFG
jgi:hypothetical protein